MTLSEGHWCNCKTCKVLFIQYMSVGYFTYENDIPCVEVWLSQKTAFMLCVQVNDLIFLETKFFCKLKLSKGSAL